MSSITTINSGDLISGSRTDINTNFSNLNTDKIETSVLDTDTALAANSDSKIASQKATKAYADSVAGANASETAKGNVEEATDAEVTAGTATGSTGAKLFITPTKLLTYLTSFITTNITSFKQYTVGALDNSLVKTYFNMQLPFILWVGAVVNDTTTTFPNWARADSAAEVFIPPMGAMADFRSTTSASLTLTDFFYTGASNNLSWDSTNILIMDWWAKLPASGTGDISMGIASQSSSANSFISAYNASDVNRVMFTQSAAGALYATISKTSVGVTNTDISSGLTLTNWNNYRIEFDISNNALFYVNGVLKATLSGANIPTSAGDGIAPGFGRSNTSLFQVTAPTLSVQMNP